MTVRLEELLAAATPGPWIRANAFGEYADGPAIKNADDFDWVATVQVSNVSQWRENAALIALAPDAVRLLIDMGWTLRQIENLVNHDYRLKHHDHTFIFNTIQQVVDGDDVPELLARLDRLGT